MNEEDSSIESKSDDELKVGQLYTWDGHALVPVQPSEQAKIPVMLEALDAVRRVRAQATRDGFPLRQTSCRLHRTQRGQGERQWLDMEKPSRSAR